MDKIQFWTLIDRFRNSPDPESAAVAGLSALSAVEAIWFGHWQFVHWCDSATWPLFDFLAMAYDDCFGDESFDHFRAWLVYQGREVHEAAVNNPESLIDVLRQLEFGAEASGEGGAYSEVIRYLDSIDQQAIDPRLLPPEYSFPGMIGSPAPRPPIDRRRAFFVSASTQIDAFAALTIWTFALQ